MKVDFNRARERAIDSYSDLVRKLNEGLSEDGGYVTVNAPQLQGPLERLRDALVTIGCTFEEGNPDFKCILDDSHRPVLVFGEKEDGSL